MVEGHRHGAGVFSYPITVNWVLVCICNSFARASNATIVTRITTGWEVIGSILTIRKCHFFREVECNLGNGLICNTPQYIRITIGTFHFIDTISISSSIIYFRPRTGCHIRIEDDFKLCNLVFCIIIYFQIDIDVGRVLWSIAAISNHTCCRIPEHHKAAIAILCFLISSYLIIEIKALIVIIVPFFSITSQVNIGIVASFSDSSITRYNLNLNLATTVIVDGRNKMFIQESVKLFICYNIFICFMKIIIINIFFIYYGITFIICHNLTRLILLNKVRIVVHPIVREEVSYTEEFSSITNFFVFGVGHLSPAEMDCLLLHPLTRFRSTSGEVRSHFLGILHIKNITHGERGFF